MGQIPKLTWFHHNLFNPTEAFKIWHMRGIAEDPAAKPTHKLAARIILTAYKHPEWEYRDVAQNLRCAKRTAEKWMQRWKNNDLGDLFPDPFPVHERASAAGFRKTLSSMGMASVALVATATSAIPTVGTQTPESHTTEPVSSARQPTSSNVSAQTLDQQEFQDDRQLEEWESVFAHQTLDQIALVLSQLDSVSDGHLDASSSSNHLSIGLMKLDTGEFRFSDGSTPRGRAEGAFAVLSQNILTLHLDQILFSDRMITYDEIDQGTNFLEELFHALVDTLTNPEKLASILADTAIVSPGLYLCWQLAKKLERLAEHKKNRPMQQVASKTKQLLAYFETVPKSRVAEIGHSTGLRIDEIVLLLRLMCFVHQPNCFWQPPLRRER